MAKKSTSLEPLRFRQIHLDFHTHGSIPGIGKKFDAKHWQKTLQLGHVDSVTLFGRCHHGWCYYPTKIGDVHPNLDFDLLGAQIEASKAIGVNTPVYITVGWDELYAYAHPEHLISNPEDRMDPDRVAWKRIGFWPEYIDFVIAITEEIIKNYDTEGIFYDIVGLYDDTSLFAQTAMRDAGMDPESIVDRDAFCRAARLEYFKRTGDAIKKINPNVRVFHNAGHVPKGDREFLKYASHLELESLPTGGWGYDHFPLSAKYTATQKGVEVMGMTGKFHTSWGEFGGFKHPNALRYECAAMLAYGTRCSVGDQLHPNGEINTDTYKLIGAAYAEVEAKEAWCVDTEPVHEIGLLSCESLPGLVEAGDHFGGRSQTGDVGASRVLLERQVPFDVLDTEANFEDYKIIILADNARLDAPLTKRLKSYLKNGGKLVLSGDSGMKKGANEYVFDGIGTVHPAPDFDMEYFQARPALRKLDTEKRLVASPFVVFGGSHRVKPAKGATVLADIVEPYFKRTLEHFCSHQHAPDAKKSGYPAAFVNAEGNIAVFPPHIFDQYRSRASIQYRDLIVLVLEYLLGKPFSIQTSLGSSGRVSLMQQKRERRYVLHLLYATPIKRADNIMPKWGKEYVEVIEDIPVLPNVEVSVTVDRKVKRVLLAPSGEELPFTREGDTIRFTVPELDCHQMIELGY